MKKFSSIVLPLVLIFLMISSCGISQTNNSINDSHADDIHSDSEQNIVDNNSTNDSKDDIYGENTQIDNSTKHQFLQVEKYYREIESNYTKEADGVEWENDQIFLDSTFEISKESQFVVVSSFEELKAFTLLDCEKIEDSIFENNYIVAILHYYKGPSVGAKFWAGFYNADFNNNHTIDLDKGRYPQAMSTADIRDVYRLHFIVVPKTEINVSEGVQKININENKLEEYPIQVYNIPNITEEITAYYVPNEYAKNNISELDTINDAYQFPYIVIHLNEGIQTDYVVKDFQYTNGEIFITVEIFEKREMEYLHEHSTNLIIAILPDRPLNSIPAECQINVVFKNVVSVN